jgi:hypothetical protein
MMNLVGVVSRHLCLVEADYYAFEVSEKSTTVHPHFNGGELTESTLVHGRESNGQR